MKTLLYILLFNISAISFAQDQQLFENTWYLQNVIIDGNDNLPPSNNEVTNITILFLQNAFYVSTHVCDVLDGNLIYDNTQFTFNNWGMTLGGCVEQENSSFQNIYLDNFFVANINDTFTYNIVDESNNTKTLTITNSSENDAIYCNELLSMQDFNSSQFSIHPNPAKNKLYISATDQKENLAVKVFNTEGKLLNTQTLDVAKQATIDVSNLSSGMYFLNIEDGNGNTEVKKFIKE